jgi:hypothetical protein
MVTMISERVSLRVPLDFTSVETRVYRSHRGDLYSQSFPTGVPPTPSNFCGESFHDRCLGRASAISSTQKPISSLQPRALDQVSRNTLNPRYNEDLRKLSISPDCLLRAARSPHYNRWHSIDTTAVPLTYLDGHHPLGPVITPSPDRNRHGLAHTTQRCTHEVHIRKGSPLARR